MELRGIILRMKGIFGLGRQEQHDPYYQDYFWVFVVKSSYVLMQSNPYLWTKDGRAENLAARTGKYRPVAQLFRMLIRALGQNYPSDIIGHYLISDIKASMSKLQRNGDNPTEITSLPPFIVIILTMHTHTHATHTYTHTHTHTHTHARKHARTHARTHARMQERTESHACKL